MTRTVEVTRPDKLLWPALEITKRRYVDYLDAVAGCFRGSASDP